MVAPIPPVALRDHCSVLNKNTLYVYSPDALQSISFEEGAEWKQLPMGVSVTGARCVQAVPNGDDSQSAMYIVGGSTNATMTNYSGLQRYSFAENKWETIWPAVQVTQNRRNHGAAYLNDSSSLLVYAGSQNGYSGPSSETFVISTNPPYSVQAFSSDAPPAVIPMVLPWNSSHAVMVGGSTSNAEVFTFDPGNGWSDLGVNLQEGLPDSSQAQSTVVQGDDGSRVLETYDLAVSPNRVSRVVLMGANGQKATAGQSVGDATSSSTTSSPTSSPVKRDLTLENWPPYNGTLAPTTTRSGFALSQGSNGIVVISGGDDQDPLSIFNQTGNAWVNATELFNGAAVKTQNTLNPSNPTTSSSTPTDSAAAHASSGTGAAQPKSGHSKSMTILGAVLGTLFGLIAICILLLFLIRWKRSRKQTSGDLGQKASSRNEKNRLSFADRGASFMKEAGFSPPRGHKPAESMDSQTSLAIISGWAGMGHKRGLFSKGSKGSLRGSWLFTKKKSPLNPDAASDHSAAERGIALSPTGAAAMPAARAPMARPPPPNGNERSRNSGWSKYFAGNSATNLAHLMPSASAVGPRQSTYTQDSQSHYSESRAPSTMPHRSAEVPPLDLRRYGSDQTLSQVTSGSPVLGHSSMDLFRGRGVAVSEGLTAHISRRGSTGTASDVSDDDLHASSHNASPEEMAWTPVSGPSFDVRPPSSIYTDSVNRNSAVTIFPRGVAASSFPFPPQGNGSTGGLSVPGARNNFEGNSNFVGHPSESQHNQDFSWLNLGDVRKV
ncbi:hypothetical protein L228DRAFT_235473 [Xylona heveae TC161]|uniref:Galactose oxidase n=1 Tax=Xylona heveae (strain CBS 132557 / TC161) TaxID=1328760 RepID=A0A165JLL4_XYLHT|nr:hypothetical protein L228DRAFT_235473 [Xylona heveae TC161]KZF26394.1 hypothetical protein L228DRAFT_235473 [Xylona heveae TC161]